VEVLRRQTLYLKYRLLTLFDGMQGERTPEYDPSQNVVFGPRGVLVALPELEAVNPDDRGLIEVAVYRGPGVPEGKQIGAGEIDVEDGEVDARAVLGGGDLIPWPNGRTAVTIYQTLPPAAVIPRYSFVLELLVPSTPVPDVPVDPDAARHVAEFLAGATRESTADPRLEPAHVPAVIDRLGRTAALEPVLNATADPDWRVRKRAAYALCRLGDARVVDALICLLADPQPDVRRSAAETLRLRHDRRACEPLIQALGDPDVSVRSAAAVALRTCGDARAVEPLLQLLSDASADLRLRCEVAWALGTLRDPRALSPMLDLLRQPARELNRPDRTAWHHAWRLSRSVQTGLSFYGAGAVRPLLRMLQDPDYRVRQEAAWALHNIHDPRVLPAIIEAANDPHPEVRHTARELLKVDDSEGDFDQLLAALEHESPLGRLIIGEFAGRHGDPRALPALERVRDMDQTLVAPGVRMCQVAEESIALITARQRAMNRDPRP
jgi:HEAT repeat protein